MGKLGLWMNEHGDILLVTVTGALDTDTSEQFDASLMASAQQGWKKFVVDMSQLEYMSSAGIGALIGNLNEIRESGGDMHLVGVPHKIMQILDMLDLSSQFHIFSDQASAVASYQ